MGAEREDTDPNPKRVGTEPGLGKSSGPAVAAAPPEEDELAPVDFDALHAALGDPLDYDDLGSAPVIEVGPADESDELLDGIEAAAQPGAGGKLVRASESSGRSSATYASARPHTIPPTRAPVEDPNVPAVIVASNDTVPTAPPKMTVPLAAIPGQPPASAYYPGAPAPGAPPMHGHPPQGGYPSSNPVLVAAGPHAGGHPGSGPHPNAPPAVAYPQTPPRAFAAARGGQMTIRMPERPINPRRGKTPTMVVRPRGPSARQKLMAFMVMLLLCTAAGIAGIRVARPRWLGLDPAVEPVPPSPAPGASGASGALGASSASAGSAGATSASASSSAASPSASSSSKKPPKLPR